MNNLSELMQDRLDKWRKNTLPVASKEILREKPVSRRNGKNDYGDVETQEQWDEEVKRSQKRK